MKKKIKIGDKVSLRSAALFGLETYIKTKLNENPDDDYHVGTVSWGREGFGQDETLDKVISFIEPPKPVEIPPFPQNSNIREYTWDVYVQGMLPDSFVQPTFPAYEMVTEVKRILQELIDSNIGGNVVNNILKLGPKAQKSRGESSNIHDLKIGSETVRGPGEHSSFAFFWLPLRFGLVEDLKNPWVTTQDPL